MLWSLALGFAKGLIGPVFDFLNKRVDAAEQIHIIDSQTMGTIAAGGQAALATADNLKAQVWMKQGNWGPMTWFMASVLAPLVWHLWQVVGDSSRWLPSYEVAWGFIPYPAVAQHVINSWHVAALPAPFDSTEMYIFTSLFIGASTAAVTIGAIKAIKR